jgi:hypothetical protein
VVYAPAVYADVAKLMTSKDHPLPVIPVVVGQADSREQIAGLIAPGQHPTIFQISNADGPYATLAKVWMFSEVALEYPNIINFVKVPAGSAAAKALYDKEVTRPVYISSDPSKSGSDRFSFVDEGQLRADQVFSQISLEAFIVQALNIQPALFGSFQLTAENEHHTIYEFRPATSAPTAKWVAVLFFANNNENVGQNNRLRVLFGAERFFYAGRLRMVECDLATQSQVYQTVINNGQEKPLPTEPELWIINPDTHQAAQYMSGQDGPPIAELTHAALQAFLAKNAVERPPATANAFNTVKAWPELELLAKAQRPAPGSPPAGQ